MAGSSDTASDGLGTLCGRLRSVALTCIVVGAAALAVAADAMSTSAQTPSPSPPPTCPPRCPIPGSGAVPPGGSVDFTGPVPTPGPGGIRPPGGPQSLRVLNLSDQPATVAYDGRALSVAVPAGFIPQVYDRYASSGPRCDPAAGRPNVANCAVSGRPPKVLTLTTLPVSGSFEEVGLVAGCNEVRLTWPVGTPLGIVAAAVAPLGAMESIFKFDPARGRFRGYSPAVPIFLDDYTTVEARLEAVFICTREAGTFTRPQP